MNFRILVAAGAAALITAGAAMAQGAGATPAAATTPSVTHSTSASSASTHTATVSSSSNSEAISCRTRHDVGSACACRKAPTRRGTVEAGANGGHNMCAVPASHHA